MNYYWLLLPAAMLVLAVVCFWDAPNYHEPMGFEEDEDSSENQVGSGEG